MVAGIRIVLVVRKRLTVADEVLDVPCGYGEVQPLAEQDSHVRDADHFAAGIEERSARVAGVDGRISLDIGQAVEAPLAR